MRITLIFALFVIGTHPSHAYLDPGTGSILIQSLIAAVVAGALVIKTYWYRIKTFFDKSPADDDANVEDADNKDLSE